MIFIIQAQLRVAQAATAVLQVLFPLEGVAGRGILQGPAQTAAPAVAVPVFVRCWGIRALHPKAMPGVLQHTLIHVLAAVAGVLVVLAGIQVRDQQLTYPAFPAVLALHPLSLVKPLLGLAAVVLVLIPVVLPLEAQRKPGVAQGEMS